MTTFRETLDQGSGPMIGQTLSHHRITAKLGEGWMGEVYLPHDERLDRDAAIKVLPEEVAQDEVRPEATVSSR